MSRINTNVNSLIAQRVLKKNNDVLNTSLERLSTGLKINRGSDNPAGLIASENLRAEKSGISQAIENAERASNLIGTAEGGLSEISNLLSEMQSLITEASNSGALSSEEVAANQLQMDSILSTIDRLAGNTEFQGKKLLNGSLGYTTSSVSTNLNDVRINSARLPDGAKQTVTIAVTQSAQIGKVNGGTTAVGAGGVTLEIVGNFGTEQLSFASSTSLASIVTAVSNTAEATGVSAMLSGSNLVFTSTGYGKDRFVTVKAIAGSFNSFTAAGTKDEGQDAKVNVNGTAAIVKGRQVSARTNGLDLSFEIKGTLNGVNQTTTLGVTGGGAEFTLGGRVSEAVKKSLGISSVTTGSLGNATDGYLSSLKSGGTNDFNAANFNTAQKIVSEAIKQVSTVRGRLGAFQTYELGSTVNALGIAYENLAASESAIRDTDFSEETAKLTRAQILSQASSSVLSQANASPQAALRLLQ